MSEPRLAREAWRRGSRRLIRTVLLVPMVAGVIVALPVSATSATSEPLTKASITMTLRATVNMTSLANDPATSGGDSSSELGPTIPEKPTGATPLAPSQLPSPPFTPRASGQLAGFRQWNGINHKDQRFANHGQQFSLEPPDQGLCVGGGYVVEPVNLAINVYSTSGSQALRAVVTENQFNSFPNGITRTGLGASGGPPFGPFLSDPRCYYDKSSGRFFHLILEIDLDQNTGQFLDSSRIELAVSQTGNPLGNWNIYEFDSTDAGHPNCPCFGDQPLLGADAKGIYLSTAEYATSALRGEGSGFNGPQLYAFPKSKLTSGMASITGVQFSDLHHNEAVDCYESGTLQPAFSPQGVFATGDNGTEFLLSGRDTIPCDGLGSINPAPQSSITAWALTNTNKLGTNPLLLNLTAQDVATELYQAPPTQTQPDGSRPLGQKVHEAVPPVLANDDRMNQVVFAAGLLWAGVNTAVGPGDRSGIAWFVVTPGVSSGQVTASMANQGYVNVADANVSFPSIGVNSAGSGIMTFSLMGPADYPSHGYLPITSAGTGSVYTAAAGQLPEDGVSCYPEFGPTPGCRWGDYSAAVADPTGSRIWFAAEFIWKNQRTYIANWATSIASVKA